MTDMLVADIEGRVTHIQPVPKIEEDRVPSRHEIERALLLIQMQHGSTVGAELDVLRRALFFRTWKGEDDE